MTRPPLFNIYCGQHAILVAQAMAEDLKTHLLTCSSPYAPDFWDTAGYIDSVVSFAKLTFHMARIAQREAAAAGSYKATDKFLAGR